MGYWRLPLQKGDKRGILYGKGEKKERGGQKILLMSTFKSIRISFNVESEKFNGNEFLEIVLNKAYRLLGNERIDNLYRACLLGGDVGTKLMLKNDERCITKWGEGNITKATRILEVWASTAVLRLLQHQEDQEAVRKDTVRGFLSLFNNDKDELETELFAYQEAIKAETLRGSESGLRNFSSEILYLRTLRALGDEGVPSFKLLPVPWGTLREMSQANPKLFEILDVNILLKMEPWLSVTDALISALQAAQEYFNRMDK